MSIEIYPLLKMDPIMELSGDVHSMVLERAQVLLSIPWLFFFLSQRRLTATDVSIHAGAESRIY